jgi:hypothetical protein
VVQLYEQYCLQSEYRLCPKLTHEHVHLTSFGKMRVSLAAQVLSASVANAIEHVYGEQAKSTVDFINIMNKWFDIMNVKIYLKESTAGTPISMCSLTLMMIVCFG